MHDALLGHFQNIFGDDLSVDFVASVKACA